MAIDYQETIQLLVSLEEKNVALAVEFDKLIATPASVLTSDQVETIRDTKADLIQILRQSESLPACNCGGRVMAIPTFDGYENFECFQCGNCSGCRSLT